MNRVSQRSLNAYQSPIRKLSAFADQAKAEGVTIFHLNIGQPDVASPIHPKTSLENWSKDYLPYGKSEGEDKVRKKFQAYYAEWGISLREEDILVTTGASEALSLTLYAIMDQGDELIVQEPFYANYNGISKMAGVSIRPIYTPFEEGFPVPDVQKFEEVVNEHTRALLLCNPNNPTGKVYSKKMLIELAELVLKYDLYLIVDEVYREFCYEEDFYSVLHLEHIRDRVIVLDSISKRYNACGARVGCIVTHNRLVQEQILKYAQLRLSPPMLAQEYAEQIINPGPEYSNRILSIYKERRNYVISRLEKIPGVTINHPEGAFYIFAKFPVDSAEHFCKWLLTDFRSNNNTVMLAPGNGFYSTEGLGHDELRIAYVLELEQLKLAMDCLEKALVSYPMSAVTVS
ncbi:pyridoxal phosphate-dependent aminotransferase [Membranihabitans marinus]|uniref:pyridoxal phosphate-dependent aminotransferase n=1 Tax=Membranihabitans marinus TaxID=1227546 RepID=UPI001F22A74C|nr:pyridoxal phosphate-dependent aminotransferase [Membranihabitans marinus]